MVFVNQWLACWIGYSYMKAIKTLGLILLVLFLLRCVFFLVKYGILLLSSDASNVVFRGGAFGASVLMVILLSILCRGLWRSFDSQKNGEKQKAS